MFDSGRGSQKYLQNTFSNAYCSAYCSHAGRLANLGGSPMTGNPVALFEQGVHSHQMGCNPSFTRSEEQSSALCFFPSIALLQKFSGLGDHWFVNHFAMDNSDSFSRIFKNADDFLG